MTTNISWTDETWNPVVGCSKVSEGCLNCYAERMAKRLAAMGMESPHKNPEYMSVVDENGWTGKIELCEHRLDQPLHWRKPRRIFVCSMSDLFHNYVPFEFIHRVLTVFALCPRHIGQILTKRPERMLEYFVKNKGWLQLSSSGKPLPNLHLGVTCENQKRADERIPILLQIPAAKRFVSLEPLLEPIWLGDCLGINKVMVVTGPTIEGGKVHTPIIKKQWTRKLKEIPSLIDQVIIGCESRGGWAGRFQKEFNDAAIDIVRQCKAAGVKCHVKQIPINGKVSHKMSEWPSELRVQELI